MSREERIKKDFETHVSTITQYAKLDINDQGNDIEVLTWKKPDSYNYMIRYIVSGNTLCVHGDLGEAIYQWSQNLTFEWLSKLDLQYFAGKCQASEVGRDFKEWDEHKALETLKQFEEEEYFKWEEFEEKGGEEALCDEREWEEWLRENGHEVMGDDFYEWAFGIGKTINTRCVYHFIGLQMAMKQIKENAEAV